MMQATLAQSRHFARFTPPKEHIPEDFVKREKELFEQRVDKRAQMLFKARRLALIELEADPKYNETLWWRKLATMSEEQMEMLPYGFTLKYGTFVRKIEEQRLLTNTEANRNFEGRYDKVKNIKYLKTNEELAEAKAKQDLRISQPNNDPNNYEFTDYMKRQPRMDLRTRNFNFEAYHPYIKMYEDSRVKDEEDSNNFYKLVKYVKARKGTNEELTNSTVKEFLKKYRVDLIDIPEEFKDL